MLIKIYKQRTLQASQFEPISFGYGLEEENGNKEKMEKQIDGWLEKETEKWNAYKNKSSGNAVKPIKERSPF